jgi:hypothetical protein
MFLLDAYGPGAIDPAGTVYALFNLAIVRISSTGAVSAVAGAATRGSADGLGSAARINSPQGIAS